MQIIIINHVYETYDIKEKIGIIEEETIDKKSGEIKTQINLCASARLFVIKALRKSFQQRKVGKQCKNHASPTLFLHERKDLNL